MKKLLVSLLLLHQLVFLNASELIRDFDVNEPVQFAEQFDKDLYARDIPALVATLQQAVEENEASGGIYTEPFTRFNNTVNGYNILHIATMGASYELTELALKVKVDKNSQAVDRHRDTPLHLVSGCTRSKKDNEKPSYNPAGRLAIAEMLLSNNADVNKVNFHDRTPLFYAIINDNVDLVDLFLQHGAIVNFDDLPNDEQLLYKACYYSNLEIVKLLLEYGANPFCVAGKLRISCNHQSQERPCCCLEIKKVVALYARHLVPCYGDSTIWNRVIKNLETW